jgi:hypothetical protein
MTTTEPLTPPYEPDATGPPGDARGTKRPAFADILADVVPVIGVVFVAGPPVVFIAGPWLLFVLMLSAPFAVLVAFAAAALAVAALVTALAGILATPYLILRGRHRRGQTRQPIAVAGAHVAPLAPRRAAA